MNRPVKHLPPLPAERALKVIAGRGKAVLLYQLFDGPLRLSELWRRGPGLSHKVLIQQLHEMQAHGLVQRLPEGPASPHPRYVATALGRSLAPVLRALCDWGRHHAAALDELDRLADCATEASEPPRAVQPPAQPLSTQPPSTSDATTTGTLTAQPAAHATAA